MLQPTPQPGGSTVPITGPAAKFSRTPTRVRHGAPALGEHTDAILEELGVDAGERERLRADEVI
jgi:formyl-CoA transferase